MTRRKMMGLSVAVCMAMIARGVAAGPQLPDLNWVERSDWLNVKTAVTPAAVGDGVADDTAALQTALDMVQNDPSGKTNVIYMPPGTYRITNTLHLAKKLGTAWIGHGRSTRIVWDGETNSVHGMYWSDGVSRSRYVGMVWDGRNISNLGHDHASTTLFETRVRYEHMAFVNFTGAGIRTGVARTKASTETMYENCLFTNNADAAVDIINFNDYDHIFNGCEFRDNGNGIRTAKGHVHVWNTHFENTRGTDFYQNGDHCYSVRRCTSIGAGQFVVSCQAPMTIQDCWVSGWKNKDGAIFQRGAPLLAFDCTFVDPPNSNAPIRVAAGKLCRRPECKVAEAVELDLGEGLIGDDRSDRAFGGQRGQLDADREDRSHHDQTNGHNAGGDQHFC